MESLEDIKKRIDIVDFAERLGVEVLPNRKQAHCFNKQMHKHGDSNPSLSFTSKNGIGFFKCFSCGVSGSIIDLLAGVKGIDTKEAIKEIKQMYGGGDFTPAVVKPRLPEVAEVRVADKGVRDTYNKLYTICSKHGLGDIKDYLTGDKRGLTEDTIKEFRLFAINKPQEVIKELKEVCSIEELLTAGLFDKGSRGVYFKFKDYPIVIPYIEGGDIVYIKARRLDSKQPKYMQVKGLSIPLFNRDILKTMDKAKPLYICEGEFDTMITAQNGFNAVGVVGVNGLKQEIVRELVGFNVYLAFDNDTAGQVAIKEVANKLILGGVNVLGQTDLPEGVKDLTDYFITFNSKKI
jgi:DNA primase